MTNKLGSSNPNRIPKKSNNSVTQHKAQALMDEIMDDKLAIQSRGKELLDLIDKSQLNEDELKELEETYEYVENKNKKIKSMVFNEQIKSDGKVDKYGVPTSVSFQDSVEKFETLSRNKISLKESLLKLALQENIPQEQAEQLVAGTTEKVAGESWDIISKMSHSIGVAFGNRIQDIIRENEKVANKSVVRKTTQPKATDEETRNLIKRNKAIRMRYLKLSNTYRPKKAFEILEREYNLKYTTLKSIVYK